ncbi:hypothetical protein [uncultured phage cr29_1]|uniref:Uncharacterized protein n=1 Tax=uncultured phage cr29_1 TaxID=2986418 RepID=A0AAE7S1A0_9CAUD|nr:hypothetical protein [uncultured phage cr29_1]
MIQEKDFLYRVPVKNALVTTPGKQVRNPEILVDLEGGEFMHGDILDANSTNKLIDQSVKDAIDNSIENGNYVTKDLLEAETSARTKSDEDLNAKIKAEQTRAEGKEKEISDKLAIVDGDSNTEGSFRKAIADVIAAAPEDLDTLKEIADKLAGNDDLHTALNQAITEKADASALANEVTRATGVENDLRTAIGTKADATALSNYVLTTALNQQIDTLNAAISAKQDAGNYIPYDSSTISQYSIGKNLYVTNNNEGVSIQSSNITGGNQDGAFYLDYSQLYFVDFQNIQEGQAIRTTYSINGITSDKYNNCLATSDGTFKPISDFALKTELPTVPTNVSQLTNDSNFITQQDADAKYALANSLNTVNDSISSLRVGLSKKQNKITVNSVDVTDIETADITKLRTIVRSLIDALNTSGLIRTSSNIE